MMRYLSSTCHRHEMVNCSECTAIGAAGAPPSIDISSTNAPRYYVVMRPGDADGVLHAYDVFESPEQADAMVGQLVGAHWVEAIPSAWAGQRMAILEEQLDHARALILAAHAELTRSWWRRAWAWIRARFGMGRAEVSPSQDEKPNDFA